MLLSHADIQALADTILKENTHLFPSNYPDIPLNIAMLKDALEINKFSVDKDQIPDLIQDVELALAAIVPLNWSNYGTIAILLNEKFHNEELLAISEERITALARQLPNFADNSEPDEDAIDSIIYTWISLTDEELNLEEDESWS